MNTFSNHENMWRDRIWGGNSSLCMTTWHFWLFSTKCQEHPPILVTAFFKRPMYSWNTYRVILSLETNADLCLNFPSFSPQFSFELRILSWSPAPCLPLIGAQWPRDIGLASSYVFSCSLLHGLPRAPVQTNITLWRSCKLLFLECEFLYGSREVPACPLWELWPPMPVSYLYYLIHTMSVFTPNCQHLWVFTFLHWQNPLHPHGKTDWN